MKNLLELRTFTLHPHSRRYLLHSARPPAHLTISVNSAKGPGSGNGSSNNSSKSGRNDGSSSSGYSHHHQEGGSLSSPTLFLTHVNWGTGKNGLEKYFSQYGRVKDIEMFYDSQTGLHRGFAALTYEHARSASAAMRNRPHVVDGDVVGMEVYMPLKENPMEKFKRL